MNLELWSKLTELDQKLFEIKHAIEMLDYKLSKFQVAEWLREVALKLDPPLYYHEKTLIELLKDVAMLIDTIRQYRHGYIDDEEGEQIFSNFINRWEKKLQELTWTDREVEK